MLSCGIVLIIPPQTALYFILKRKACPRLLSIDTAMFGYGVLFGLSMYWAVGEGVFPLPVCGKYRGLMYAGRVRLGKCFLRASGTSWVKVKA